MSKYIYILLINILSLILMKIDKSNAINKKYRISEKSLITISFFGGGIGTLIGMKLFHHKTKKLNFIILIPISIITNIYFFIKII